MVIGKSKLYMQFSLFQCRGWGVETAHPHINEIYHKQLDLQEQASRRECLSALSLAFANQK